MGPSNPLVPPTLYEPPLCIEIDLKASVWLTPYVSAISLHPEGGSFLKLEIYRCAITIKVGPLLH